MFYESQEVEVNLTCPFCWHKFSDVVKLIPECGNSICGDCYEELRNGLMIVKFQCKPCEGAWHTMPGDELPDNKALMKILRVKPQERPLSDKAKNLKLMLEHMQRRIGNLSSWDETDEIKVYCEQLEHEVLSTAEKAIKHLTKIKGDLLKQIDDYRQDLLARSNLRRLQLQSPSVDLRHMNFDLYRIRIASEIESFNNQWLESFGNLHKNIGNEDILKAQKQAKEYMLKITLIEKGIRQQTFTDRFLKFNPNELFMELNSYVGTLELGHEIDYKLGK